MVTAARKKDPRMKLYKPFIQLSIALGALTGWLHCAQTINRNGSTIPFSAAIRAKELDRYNGTLYIVTNGDNEYSVAQASRDDTSFTPLATGDAAALAGVALQDIALIHTGAAQATHAALSRAAAHNMIDILNLEAQTLASSTIINDAAGNPVAATTKLAASTNCLFARVLAEQNDGETGEPLNSGIATLLPDATLVQGGALSGAAQLDVSSSQVRGVATPNLRGLIVQDLHWNECLQTFYAGMFALTEADGQSAENIAYGLVKGVVDAECNLTLSAITEREPLAGSSETVFAARPTAADTNDGVNIHHVRCMNTTSGLNYLIINGDLLDSSMYVVTTNNAGGGAAIINATNPTGDTSGNKLWALPLGSAPSGDACATNPHAGCIVQNRCSSASTHLCCTESGQKCITSCNASLSTDLFDDFTITDCAAVIGGSDAPWQSSITATYTGPSISYYLRNSDQQIVSNVEDNSVGSADGIPTGANILLLRLVENETQIAITQPASDLSVVGDAVYASAGSQTLSTPLILQSAVPAAERVITVEVCANPERNQDGDLGIWVTQAQFDNAGCIAGWSGWERAYPTTGNNNGDHASCFAVDAKTAKIWKIGVRVDPYFNTDPYCTNTPSTVERTLWHRISTTPGTLQFELDAVFNDPCKSSSCCCPEKCGNCAVCESETKSTCCSTKCGNCCTCSSPACGTTGIFSILDLPGNTSASDRNDGFDGTTSYALFGGYEKVVFTRNAQTDNDTTPPMAYNMSENFHISTLPKGAGAVCSLGYTHRHDTFGVNSQYNFFYAATARGLYAYAQSDGSAFNTNANLFGALNAAPFNQSTDRWHLIADTQGKAITVTENDRGNNIYYVALDVCSPACTISDTLYRVNLNGLSTGSDNVSSLTSSIVAQSGMGGIHKNALFTGFKVISNHCFDAGSTMTESSFYGVLSTNDGIYVSTKKITDMTLQDDWKLVPRTQCIAFGFLASGSKQYAPGRFLPRTKLFGLYFKDGSTTSPGNNCQNIFQHSSLIQLGANNTEDPDTLPIKIGAHPDFNEQAVSLRRFAINRNKEIAHIDFSTYFWSDGGRRLFARFNPSDCNISQLHSLPWEGCAWNISESCFDDTLSSICRVHWIENISGTGRLMAGTDRGVIVLE